MVVNRGPPVWELGVLIAHLLYSKVLRSDYKQNVEVIWSTARKRLTNKEKNPMPKYKVLWEIASAILY